MEYRYTQERENYAVYAAGGVFYSVPGHTAFPVRLASEIYRRCIAIRTSWEVSDRAVVYDPCCGGAYHLSTLAYFNWDNIKRIYGSDTDEDAIAVATRNLSLLSGAGLARRIQELSNLHQQFGKESHAVALQNALALQRRASELSRHHKIDTHLFRADATDRHAIAAQLADTKVDVVFTDIPYGHWSSWHSGTQALIQAADPVVQLLETLLPILAPKAVVAVAAAKKDKIAHECYRRLEKFNVGKRQIVLLQPNCRT
jgi:23S rRNA (guanine2535-N1)-methyltransferase